MLTEFKRLREAWSVTSAGQGGYSALAGFDFQINRALLEVIRSHSTGGGLVLMEVLSDLVRQEGGLVVAQLKRTMSSSALHKGLQELWSIDQLAKARTPTLQPLMRYEVQAARAGLRDAPKSMAGWSPTSPFDAADLTTFKARVELVIAADPRLEAARLLISQYSDDKPFQTVDRFAGRLLRAENEAAMVEASDDLKIELEALRSTATQRLKEYRLWGVEDRVPAQTIFEPDASRAVRVGQRLTIADLTQGRLADRRVYENLHNAAEDWLDAVIESNESIPAFWIEGRSGAGKSAALLHLLARLHAEDPRRVIIWLGPRADRFGEAVRRFSDLIGEGRQVIIAIDDPLSPAQQSKFAAAVQEAAEHWVNLPPRRASGADNGVVPPVLVCCGPTEQREFGEDSFAAELEITPVALLRETAEDLEELAAWFQIRTGKPAPELSGDILLVQRFFEWNEGDIREFALRFKQRLVALNAGRAENTVFEAVARILAFGRLYADYPAAPLREAMEANDGLGAAFDQLSASEAHLEFVTTGDGVRLTHPHLADAIYREWFGRPSDKRARKRHLADGLRAAAQSVADPEVRFAPFWAIARLVRTQGGRPLADDIRARIDLIWAELKELLPELYAELLPTMDRLTDIPVWLALNQELDLALEPSPMALASEIVQTADQPQRGLRLCCHILLSYAGSDASQIGRVADLLNRLSDWRGDDDLPWRDWSFVARDLIHRGGAALLIDAVLQLVERSPRWRGLDYVAVALVRKADSEVSGAVAAALLARTEDASWRWAQLLRELLHSNVRFPGLGGHAYRFLLVNPRADQWSPTLEAARQSGLVDAGELQTLALAWLGVRTSLAVMPAEFDTYGYDQVLSHAFEHAQGEIKSELGGLGLSWLRASGPQAHGWSWIWPALWADDATSGADRDELREIGVAWLKTLGSHAGWSFVWHALENRPDSVPLADIRQLGRAWLGEVSPAHAGWNFVFDTLWKNGDADAQRDLIPVACQWLTLVPQHRGWSAIWDQILWHPDADKPGLMSMGRAWLRRAAIEHPSWKFVARIIFPRVTADDEDAADLGAAGIKWLRANLDDAMWFKIYAAISEFVKGSDLAAVCDQVIASVRVAGSRSQLRTVQAVLEVTTDPAVRLELAKWLHQGLTMKMTDRYWPSAWITVKRFDPALASTSELLDLADAWLSTTPKPLTSWSNIWPTWRFVLKSEGRRADVHAKSEISLAWLCSASPRQKRWFDIWNALQSDRPDLTADLDLVAAQTRWLHMPAKDRSQWARVLQAHRKVCSDWQSDERLTEQVHDWLAAAPDPEHFATVWSAALLMALDLDELCAMAACHLQNDLDGAGWQFVWKLTERKSRGRPIRETLIVAVETALLSKPPTHVGWIEKLVLVSTKVRLSDDFLKHIAQDLAPLSRQPLGRRILSVIQPYKAAMKELSAPTLLDLLVATSPRRPRFPHIWSSYVAAAGSVTLDTRAVELAVVWLSGAMSHRNWPWIWRDVWKLGQERRPQLRLLGRAWLKAAADDAPGRTIVHDRVGHIRA